MKDQVVYLSDYSHNNEINIFKEQLRKKVTQYGEFTFDDDKWYCSKKHKDTRRNSVYTLYFEKVPPKYKDLLKYYALFKKGAIHGKQKEIIYIRYFLEYLLKYHPKTKLNKVSKEIIYQYEVYIGENLTPSSKLRYYLGIKNFFKVMKNFPELPDINPTKLKNPFKEFRKNNDDKYIPLEVIQQWDKHMKNDVLDIPIEIRTAYWILRSFPNRSHEVFGSKLDALTRGFSYYILNVPTWKQNGGYDYEELKEIPIIDVGHGGYLIRLLQELKALNEKRLREFEVPKHKKQGLFSCRWFRFKKIEGSLVAYEAPYHKDKFSALTVDKFNRCIKDLAGFLNIKDKNGKTYAPTSHQFRHNAITDRIYVGGYSSEQVSVLSKHKNMAMLSRYRHPLHDAMRKILSDKKSSSETAPVEVKGKYWNLDEKTVKILEKSKPDAYLTWEAGGIKGVGICSQIDKCNPKGTSHHFECYECDWFVPKAEYIDYYRKELEHWKKRMIQYANHPKWLPAFENAVRNALLVERIINICENGIEKHKEELLQKILRGELI
ncbi:hypothetical protein [Paenibacillus sp. DMB5]|uniref:hypothetical protein n=1 Tax=Paenibacillus sp. DMB5 TaxID=1780103 RepID=UPI00076CE55D|nr:hypothetical protein [Paenibacillus sp. DMB5]KUP25795.1 hypothetical protein AWJ19_19415 [Paenibacillus sp. DMB5]